MQRNAMIEIGGRVYPARFGIQASKAIDEKFGGLEKLGDRLTEGGLMDKMDALIFCLEAVIRQGCAYCNLFEPDVPKEDGASLDSDGRYKPISKEELEVAISLDEFEDLCTTVFSLVKTGNKQTVDTKKAKNAEAR